MKKTILLVCVLGLLAMAATGAFASATNWVLLVKASNTDYTNAGTALTLGIGPVASTSTGTWSTTAKLCQAGERSLADTTYHSKHVIAAGGTTSWDIKVGAQADYTGNAVRISLYNTALDAANRDTLLDLSGVITLSDATGVLAWFSTADHQNDLRAFGTEKWSDISTLLRAKGWGPTALATGWYMDVVPPLAGGFDAARSYTLAYTAYAPPPPDTPEPGSLLALGSGLIGMAGFAIRRRRA